MQKTQPVRLKQQKESEVSISHFSPLNLLPPGHTLVLNLKTRTLSLLCEGPVQIMEQQLSVNEIRVIVPILETFPHCCPYEVLLSNIALNTVSPVVVTRCRQRLQEAMKLGTWQQELRPIRRALSSLRNKLDSFDLEISTVRERGCSLTNLTGSRLISSIE
ncbi:MAG TPA: hypothetical protein VEL31_01195 [Ktedonobacteraceae bacterium]|nr:hypothetical protein [Ktedonobacteraceae bacterium]